MTTLNSQIEAIEVDDSFPSCKRTYATLSFYHDSVHAAEVTEALGCMPTRTTNANNRKPNGWFLSTKDEISSKDFRTHLFSIFRKLEGKKDSLELLRRNEWKIMLHCYWESESGNGGPILDHKTAEIVSSYAVDIHFDIWFEPTES